MAFIAANNVALARDFWPEHAGRLDQDKHLDLTNLPKTRIVPRDIQALLHWLYVDPLAPGQRGHVYVRSDVAGADGMLELVVRIQGIIQDVNLSPVGDWDKTAAHAHRAAQRVTLVSGGCRDAFQPQWKALDDVKTVVAMMLGAPSTKKANRMGSICLRRRVFTKVDKNTATSIVEAGEDPNGIIAAVGKQWRIILRIRCGTQTPTGGLTAVHPLSLAVGDLVDVAVTVVAALSNGPSGRKCEVFFEPKTIVRLQPAESIKGILAKTRGEKQPLEDGDRETPTNVVVNRKALDDGIMFSDSGIEAEVHAIETSAEKGRR